MALNSILIIPTILLNAIAIITILKFSQLNSKPCYFIILVQSVIDLAVGVFGFPLFLVFLASGIGKFSNCIVATLAFQTTTIPVGISTITLSAMTLERYIAILHPYAYSAKVTKKRLLIYVGSGAVMLFSLFFPSLVIQKLIAVYGTISITLVFFFTVFAYTRIYLVARKLARSQNQLHDAAGKENITRKKLFFREIKLAKSCFIVVVCFCILCFLPTAFLVTFYKYLDKFEYLVFLIWIGTLSLLNSSVNSLIFFWTKTMLRKQAVKMINSMSA
ncbi:melanocyte-stimulating hormone receptor-like [Paramuricea clavata]|uniref:Melanocyte-stimulating hormone receptor-like n=1 Tax=Paramuricea clavata TaxID=317549 RepID=A0A7D9DKM6_PARCT|nr:melanocyte-stimulating hormone receptor-like [Paramuricea clavata]